MNKRDLIDAISGRLGDKKTATEAVNAVLDTIQLTVAKGDKVAITGFGVFEKTIRPARTARNPARHADVQFLDRLKAWFATRPELKMPPVVGVLTHVDLLSPAMEWAPPYDWLHPQRPKEEQMRQAVGGFIGPHLIWTSRPPV